LDDIEVLKRHRHTVELKLGRGTHTKVRDLNFPNDHEGKSNPKNWQIEVVLAKRALSLVSLILFYYSFNVLQYSGMVGQARDRACPT
jgi:hypothetical protein